MILKYTRTCGMRLSSKPAVGKGTYSAKIKAAPGKGMNTAWYLFSYGRFNDKSYAWNEIDVEILGQQISGGKTKIWTNVWTGYCMYCVLNIFHIYYIHILAHISRKKQKFRINTNFLYIQYMYNEHI